MGKVSEAFEEMKNEIIKNNPEGYVGPSGTYTFTNKEGAIVALALGIASALFDGEIETAVLFAAGVGNRREEVLAILSRVGKTIVDQQMPPHVDAAMKRLNSKLREIDPKLS